MTNEDIVLDLKKKHKLETTQKLVKYCTAVVRLPIRPGILINNVRVEFCYFVGSEDYSVQATIR